MRHIHPSSLLFIASYLPLITLRENLIHKGYRCLQSMVPQPINFLTKSMRYDIQIS